MFRPGLPPCLYPAGQRPYIDPKPKTEQDIDYGKSGNAKSGKNTPRHREHNEKGTDKNPFGKQPPKAELLKRMKEAAAKKG